MTKYTIKKSFFKSFPFPIWRIEVDTNNNCVAVEYRNPEDTLPVFAVIDLTGNMILDTYQVSEKEWTLAALQDGKLILKSYGHDKPIQAGIKIVDINTSRELGTFMPYVYKEIHTSYIEASHRSIPSGLNYYINIHTAEISTQRPADIAPLVQQVTWPMQYNGHLPKFITDRTPSDTIWIERIDNCFLWSYHKKNNTSYDLYLTLSTKSEVIEEIVVIKNLTRLIPQPYFKVNHNIFILSSNKREIASYLV